MTKSPKENHRVAAAGGGELVFVVDVSSFTRAGFVGASTYDGRRVDIEFDDAGAGVFLPALMARRIHVRKGSKVTLSLEDGAIEVAVLPFAGMSKTPRISDPKTYYAVGREGGSILRIRKA
jgi:hypothetical protein